MSGLKTMLAVLVVMSAPGVGWGHFVFVVPDGDGVKGKVILSEDLEPDDEVEIGTISGAKLSMKNATGDSALAMVKGDHAYTVLLEGKCVVHGTADLGVQQFGGSKPMWLLYYPKTIVGNAFGRQTMAGEAYELEPVGKAGEVRFEFLIDGKPAAGESVTVLTPSGETKKMTTDAQGKTEAFAETGRYAVWGREVEKKSGEQGGKHYDEVRHYPTLVADIGAGKKQEAATQATAVSVPKAEAFGKLPESVASFGAVACDGWVYVYGGHVAQTHSYSVKAVSGHFWRMKLGDQMGTWEKLAGGPKVQGMNLAVYDGKIYRAGGMEPHNKDGEEADNYSIADVERYDPGKGKWEKLPELPKGRSSHDMAVVDGKLYVIGGWSMKGKDVETEWLKNMEVMDLRAEKPEWKEVAQPFARRALIAAVLDGKIYVIGGFDADDDPSRRVDIYDTKSGKWSTGPELPAPEMNGFAPAAWVVDGRVYLSCGDGSFNRLSADGKKWERVAMGTPRIVHRLVQDGRKVLIMGGADQGKDFDLIEAVEVGGN